MVDSVVFTWWGSECKSARIIRSYLYIQSLGRATAYDKHFPLHRKEIKVQKAGHELTGQLIQQAVHSLHVSNGLLGKMTIRSVFRSINENSTESLKSKYLLLMSMMSFGMQSSFGYDTQVYNKIIKHALKDGERGMTPRNRALWHVCGSDLTEFCEK